MAKKENVTKIPEKKTMNLYQVDNSGNNVPAFVVGLVIVAICIALFTQFLVINRLNKLNALQNEVSALQNEYTEALLKLNEYGDTKEKYYRYSDYYTKDATLLADRIDLINLIERCLGELGDVNQISIRDNTVSIKVVTKDMERISQIRQQFENDSMVVKNSVAVSTASRTTGDVISAISFRVVVQEDK